MSRPRLVGAVGLLSAGLVLGSTLAGCSGDGAAAPAAAVAQRAGTSVPTAPATSAPAATPTPSPSTTTPAATAVLPTPTATATATPTRAASRPTRPAAPAARTVVPAQALLHASTVGGVVGGRWVAGPAPADGCAAPRPAGALASRTSLLSSRGRGTLVQTVSTFRTGPAAEAAVRAVADRLSACGWELGSDMLLGEASAQLSREGTGGTAGSGGIELASVIAAEGVTVTLVGTGATATPDVWAALADIAIGSACPAAPDGCH